jgi:LacI family transcriptional regulator
MNQKVKVNDVIRATGLSRATVDRALNKRGGLHPETERLVQEAYDRLRGLDRTVNAETSSLHLRPVDAVLRMGRGLTEQMFEVQTLRNLPVRFFDMHEKGEEQTLQVVKDLCTSIDRPLILTVKNDDALVSELARARKRGKRIVALVSDLSPEARDAYVGIDNRNAGRAAALLVGHAFKSRPAKVGVVLGNYAFRCHEDREIGFRSYLRSASPHIALTDVAKGEDSIEQTRDAVLGLIRDHPDLDALYNVAGGNAGLAAALDETGLADRIFVITHETNTITVPLMRRGLINLLIGQSPFLLLETAVRAAQGFEAPSGGEYRLLDFSIHTPFNIPTVNALTGN